MKNENKREWNKSRKTALRHNRVEIKLSNDEYAVVSAKAKELKMPVGRYVRKIAVQGEIKQYDLTIYNDLMRSFHKVGSELNQIAKVANSTGSVYQKDIEDMQKSYKYFTKLMTKHFAPLKVTLVKNSA